MTIAMQLNNFSGGAGLKDDDERERLANAIERILLIEALDKDANIVNRRKMLQMLDRTFEAWRIYSDMRKHINQMLKPKSMLGKLFYSANPRNNVFSSNVGAFDAEYLQWFDELVNSLKPEQKSLIRYEVFEKSNRSRADKWASEWGVSQRTYYNRLKDTRDQLIVAIMNRY